MVRVAEGGTPDAKSKFVVQSAPDVGLHFLLLKLNEFEVDDRLNQTIRGIFIVKWFTIRGPDSVINWPPRISTFLAC